MKDGIKDIIGKTITSVVVAESYQNQQNQVFLVFSDGTHFEFYGSSFSCAGGLDRGGVATACSYAKNCGAQVSAVYPPSN